MLLLTLNIILSFQMTSYASSIAVDNNNQNKKESILFSDTEKLNSKLLINNGSNYELNASSWVKVGKTTYTNAAAQYPIKSFQRGALLALLNGVLSKGASLTLDFAGLIIGFYNANNLSSKNVYMTETLYRESSGYTSYKVIVKAYQDSGYSKFITSYTDYYNTGNR